MLSIHKYRLESENCWVEAPVVDWLKVDYQERVDGFVAWALVDLEAPERKFQFLGLETGELIPDTMLDGYQYIDSLNFNYYVLHWFVGEYDPDTGEVMKDE